MVVLDLLEVSFTQPTLRWRLGELQETLASPSTHDPLESLPSLKHKWPMSFKPSVTQWASLGYEG